MHIFNPSSFPLAVFSMVLILTGTTHLTWGPQIASTLLNPTNIYLMIFLVGLPAQYLWGVTSMTMSAVATTYVFGLLYFAATGTYYFFDSYIPIAVFLGMHLLFNDPSTSPRTELGRIIFGMLYGLSVVAIFGLFSRAGEPTFYDKLLAVPVLNLMIQGIDRVARSSVLKRFDPAALGRRLTARGRNLAYIGVWTLLFATMSAAGDVGDSHPGRVAAVLGAGVQRGVALRVPESRDARDRLLRPRVGMGVQRARNTHIRPPPRQRAACGARVRARL